MNYNNNIRYKSVFVHISNLINNVPVLNKTYVLLLQQRHKKRQTRANRIEKHYICTLRNAHEHTLRSVWGVFPSIQDFFTAFNVLEFKIYFSSIGKTKCYCFRWSNEIIPRKRRWACFQTEWVIIWHYGKGQPYTMFIKCGTNFLQNNVLNF